MFLSLCCQLAYIKTPEYEAEVREWRGQYLVVVRGPDGVRCVGVPKVLRSGRSGLDAALEEVEYTVGEGLSTNPREEER